VEDAEIDGDSALGELPLLRGGYVRSMNLMLHEASRANRFPAERLHGKGGTMMFESGRSSEKWLHSCMFAGAVILILALSPSTVSAQGKDAEFLAAAKEGRFEEAKRLAQQGADVNTRGDRGWTALLWFAGAGNAPAVKWLLDKGADVNAATADQVTPLIRASSWGHLDVVRLLVEKGANINIKAKDGWTALGATALFGHEKVKKYLEQRGAKEK
jgi:hypothetical protein